MARPKNSKQFPDPTDVVDAAHIAMHGRAEQCEAMGYYAVNPFQWKVKPDATKRQREEHAAECARFAEAFGRLCAQRMAEEDADFFTEIAELINTVDPGTMDPVCRTRYWVARWKGDCLSGMTTKSLTEYYRDANPGQAFDDSTLYRLASKIPTKKKPKSHGK